MSSAYREVPRFTELKELVHNPELGDKLEELIAAHDLRLRAPGGFFSRRGHDLSLFLRSWGFTQVQSDLVEGLVKHYGREVLVDFVRRERQCRDHTRAIFPPLVMPKEGVEKYHEQYDAAVEVLAAFDIGHKQAPKWKRIADRIRPERLALIDRLEGAQLILVPPLSRLDLVKALNSKIREYGLAHEVILERFEDDRLWNDGKPEHLAWEVVFVDGRVDIPENDLLGRGTIYHQVQSWKSFLKSQGLGYLTGSREFLTLMMRWLVAKESSRRSQFTVLNVATALTDKQSYIGYGCLFDGRIDLHRIPVSSGSARLRLRGAVGVI